MLVHILRGSIIFQCVGGLKSGVCIPYMRLGRSSLRKKNSVYFKAKQYRIDRIDGKAPRPLMIINVVPLIRKRGKK